MLSILFFISSFFFLSAFLSLFFVLLFVLNVTVLFVCLCFYMSCVYVIVQFYLVFQWAWKILRILPFSLELKLLYMPNLLAYILLNIRQRAPSAPGLIFSRFFENLTIALKKYFSSSDFGSPALLTSLLRPSIPVNPLSGPFCLRERAPWSRGWVESE